MTLALPAAAALLPRQGQLTKIGWELPAEMTEGEWEQAGLALGRIEGSLSWWLGDWWAFGEQRYGERKALVESEAWHGPSFQACMDAASVCRRFETSRRREVLTFNHHREVIGLPEAEAGFVLDWAEEEHATIRAIREKVREIKAWLAQGWTQSLLERREQVEAGWTVVASQRNVDGKQADAALLAWADQRNLLVRIDRQTEWGNPFEMGPDGDRDTVCDAFAEHYLPHKPSLLRRLPSLRGKVLVCWCHPERCHGDHLAELANGQGDSRAHR